MLPARNEGGNCGVEGLCESLETAEGALQWPRPEDWSSGEAMDREFGLVFIHEGPLPIAVHLENTQSSSGYS